MGRDGVEAGTSIGRWAVEALVAVGGSAEVYRARNPADGRPVAVKLLRAGTLPSSDRWRRFLDEERASRLLRHPRIARVEEIGEHKGRPYMVVEWVDGVTLAERLLSGPPPPDDVARVMHGVADALAAVHSLGIAHRDLSPSNIMLGDDGGVKLLDFGLAKAVRAESGLTTSWATSDGTVVGTPEYLSPEQARGETAGFASDVFSFGSVLWEAVTGDSPFRRDSVVETLHAVVACKRPPRPRVRDRTARALLDLAGACIRPTPADRPPDARHLLAELDHLRNGRRPRPGRERRTAVVAFLGAAICLAVGLAAGWFAARTTAGPPPDRGFELIPVEGQTPRLSPDGSQIVHLSPDRREIWRVPIGQGVPQKVWEGTGPVLSLALTPDGRAILFGVESDPPASTWEVAAAGGRARKIGRGRPICVSPDGETVLSLLRRAPAHTDLVACRRDGTGHRVVRAFRGTMVPLSGTFLDESRLLVALTDGLRVSALESVRIADGRTERIAEVAGVAVPGLAVPPSARVAVWCLRGSSDGQPLLGVTSLRSGGFRLLLPGPVASDPSMSADGTRLLFLSADRSSELVEVAIVPGAGEASSRYRVLPHSLNANQPRSRPDGAKLAFQSARGNLWVLDHASGDAGPFVTTGDASFNPAWSADSRLVAYSCLADGHSELWMAGADGEDPRPLTRSGANNFHPQWHPNGRHLLFISDRDGREDLYRLEIASGEVARLHEDGAVNPAVSPDGGAVAFVVPSEQGHGFLRAHALGPDISLGRLLWQRRIEMNDWAGGKPRFSPNGRWVAFDLPSQPYGADIWAVDAATGSGLHRLTRLPFPASLLGWFDWADDSRLVLAVSRRPSRFLLLDDLPRWLDRSR